MKETVKTSRTAGYLEKIFRSLNNRYFNGELEEPVITIQSTPKAYGHVTVYKKWHRADGEEKHELNIGAGTLDRPIESVVATMLHEMVHLWNIKEGIKDCSRGGTYHNKKFKEAAKARDLSISYNERIGWSVTEPTDSLIDFIIEQGWEDIQMGRSEGYSSGSDNNKGGPKTTDTDGTSETGTSKRTSSTRKLACPKCKQSVRATRSVNIICGDCMEKMLEV